MTVSNESTTTAAANVEVIDDLAEGVDLVDAETPYIYQAATRSVRWDIGSLAAGASETRWCDVQVQGLPEGSRIENQGMKAISWCFPMPCCRTSKKRICTNVPRFC